MVDSVLAIVWSIAGSGVLCSLGLAAVAAALGLNRLDPGDQPALLAQLAGRVEPLGLRLDAAGGTGSRRLP